jgi:putative ABC transport system permease protein
MYLLFKNLFRKPLRSLLTVLGVGVALFLFCFLEAVLDAFNAGINMSNAARIVVQHKESLAFMLPFSYRSVVAQQPGVQRVVPMVWFGALSQEQQPGGEVREEFFAQFATEPDHYASIYPELIVPPEALRDLMTDQRGCLLGDKIAERLNKKVGDRLRLRSTFWTKPGGDPFWEFNIRAIYSSNNPAFDRTMMLFHLKYFDEGREFEKGTTSIFMVGIDDPNRYQIIADVIDKRFANSPYETRTVTEKAFNMQFLSMMGNLKLLIRSIGLAVVLTMLLVSANTMMMSARERTREMGILKALGFTNLHVFNLLVGEALAISLLGGVSGCGLALILTNLLEWNPKPDFFPVFAVPHAALLDALSIMLCTGLLSGLVPALQGWRLKTTEALRMV